MSELTAETAVDWVLTMIGLIIGAFPLYQVIKELRRKRRGKQRIAVQPVDIDLLLAKLPDEVAVLAWLSWSDDVIKMRKRINAWRGIGPLGLWRRWRYEPPASAEKIVCDAYLAFVQAYLAGAVYRNNWPMALKHQLDEQFITATTIRRLRVHAGRSVEL